MRILKTAKLKGYSCSAPLVDARTHDERGTCSDNLPISVRRITKSANGCRMFSYRSASFRGDHLIIFRRNGIRIDALTRTHILSWKSMAVQQVPKHSEKVTGTGGTASTVVHNLVLPRPKVRLCLTSTG